MDNCKLSYWCYKFAQIVDFKTIDDENYINRIYNLGPGAMAQDIELINNGSRRLINSLENLLNKYNSLENEEYKEAIVDDAVEAWSDIISEVSTINYFLNGKDIGTYNAIMSKIKDKIFDFIHENMKIDFNKIENILSNMRSEAMQLSDINKASMNHKVNTITLEKIIKNYRAIASISLLIGSLLNCFKINDFNSYFKTSSLALLDEVEYMEEIAHKLYLAEEEAEIRERLDLPTEHYPNLTEKDLSEYWAGYHGPDQLIQPGIGYKNRYISDKHRHNK